MAVSGAPEAQEGVHSVQVAASGILQRQSHVEYAAVSLVGMWPD